MESLHARKVVNQKLATSNLNLRAPKFGHKDEGGGDRADRGHDRGDGRGGGPHGGPNRRFFGPYGGTCVYS